MENARPLYDHARSQVDRIDHQGGNGDAWAIRGGLYGAALGPEKDAVLGDNSRVRPGKFTFVPVLPLILNPRGQM